MSKKNENSFAWNDTIHKLCEMELSDSKNNKIRKVHCVRCRRPINEGDEAVRHKHFTGFYCSFKCLALEMEIAEVKKVTEELVEEDKESSGFGWDEE